MTNQLTEEEGFIECHKAEGRGTLWGHLGTILLSTRGWDVAFLVLYVVEELVNTVLNIPITERL